MTLHAPLDVAHDGAIVRLTLNRPDTVSYTHLTLPTILLV